MWTYQQFNEYLGNKNDRPIPDVFGKPRSTRVQRRNKDDIVIKYHDTDVVILHPNNTFTLNSGNWRTVTTKARINQFSAANVWQKSGIWYVKNENTPFYDGIKVDSDGNPINVSTEAQAELKRQTKIQTAIKEYVTKLKQELKNGHIDAPSGGDCWYCLFRTQDNQTMGEVTRNDHLIEHMKENYFVPSLIVRAIELHGSRAEMDYFMRRSDSTFSFMADTMVDRIGERVRAYLKTRLGVGR